VGPADGSNDWPQQVLGEFSQLIIGGKRVIHIHSHTNTPLVFADIYSDIAAYENRNTPSFSNVLMAKGLVRQTSNAHIMSWYDAEAVHPVDCDATASLRLIDVHEFQMPAVCVGAAAAPAQPSHNHSYVVGSVTVTDPPASLSTAASDKKPSVTHELPPKTTADIHKERMERVDKWLNRESRRSWKPTTFRMCVDNTPVPAHDGGSGSVNRRAEVGACQREGGPDKGRSGKERETSCKMSGCANVPQRSSSVSSSITQQQQKRLSNQFEVYDTPERDIGQCAKSQTNCTGPSSKNSSFEPLVNQQQSAGDGSPQNYFISTSTPSKQPSETRHSRVTYDAVRREHESPPFTREDSISTSSVLSGCRPEKTKMDWCTSLETVAQKHADDTNGHDYSPKYGASEIRPSTDSETSPPLAETVRTKSDLVKSPDEESVACKKSLGTLEALKKAAVDEAMASSSSGNQGWASWMEDCAPADKSPTETIPPCSLLPVMQMERVFSDHNGSDEDACSETSSGQFVMAKAPPMESDSYLTANETSSIVSATPPKKKASVVSSTVSRVELFSEVGAGDPMLVSDDETLLNDHAVSPASAVKTSPSLPSVKLEIPESHRMSVLLSCVESPHRFWVNVGSAEIAQLDRVTEVLNTADLMPAESIELCRCYAVRSVDDGLCYRAEVVEVCYGDSYCKRRLSGGSESCQCDQLMHLPTDTVSAVRVRLSLQFSSVVNSLYHMIQ